MICRNPDLLALSTFSTSLTQNLEPILYFGLLNLGTIGFPLNSQDPRVKAGRIANLDIYTRKVSMMLDIVLFTAQPYNHLDAAD